MEILKPNETLLPAIIALARKTWYATYTPLISTEQIEYMLDLFYNEEVLRKQLHDPQHHFMAMTEGDTLLGYAHCIELEHSVKLSKLYFLPEMQGRGLGRALMKEVEALVKALGYHQLELCVNRGNPAYSFYLKQGFTVKEEVDIPVGPYWMNDYVMVKALG